MSRSTVDESPAGGADPGVIEAATVLLGTDPERILLAIGLHARALDLGDLVLDVERVAHGRADSATAADLCRLGSRWWLRHMADLAQVAELAAGPSMSDPRVALPALAAAIHEHSATRVGASTAALLAGCFTVRHQLTAVARAVVADDR